MKSQPSPTLDKLMVDQCTKHTCTLETGKGSATAGLFPRVELGGFACRLEPDSRSERSIPIDDHVGAVLDSDLTCIIQQYIDSVGLFPRDDVELGSVLTPSANLAFLLDPGKYEDISFHITFK